MNLKSILPYDSYSIATKLSVEEIQKRISDNIEPAKPGITGSFSAQQAKKFHGSISNDGFTISRMKNHWYRRSWMPFISGQVISFLGSRQVKFKLRPPASVIFFMTIWFGFMITNTLRGIFNFLAISKAGTSPDLVFPLIMLLFGFFIFILPVKAESRKTKEFFIELLEGQKTDTR